MSGARAVVIGAGPAGSAAAFHLARAGLEVTIIESRAFPRVKVCGEFISPAATGLLEAIVPAAALRGAGARRVGSFVLELGDRARVLRMPSEAWALSRRSLDALLLDRARGAGARVRQPATVARVEHGGRDGRGAALVHLASDETLEADVVLHADGRGRLCPSGPTSNAPGLIGHKCHFTPAGPIRGVVIRSGPGGYVGSIQVESADEEPSRATLALVARKHGLVAARGDIDVMVRTLWPEWDAGRRTSDWLSCGVARSGFRGSGHPRAFRLGNAAAAVDPVGGEGIGLALWSGTVLAGLLAAGAAGWGGEGGVRELVRVGARYGAMYRRRLLLRRPSCLLAAEALMRPRLIGALWRPLGLPRLTLAPWYAATGKPLPGR